MNNLPNFTQLMTAILLEIAKIRLIMIVVYPCKLMKIIL
jgi:hypothetical protein